MNTTNRISFPLPVGAVTRARYLADLDRDHGYQRGQPCARMPKGTRWQLRQVLQIDGRDLYCYARGTLWAHSSIDNMELPKRPGATGPTWLVSISRSGARASDDEVRDVLIAFGMHEAEEDNHEPGVARKFFLIVDPAERTACECKADEEQIVEPDGFTWSNPKPGSGEECRGCSYGRSVGKACPIHGATS